MKNTRARQLARCLILLGAVVAYSPFTKAQMRPVEKVDARTLSVLDQPGAPIRVGASYHNDTSPALRDIPPAPYVGKQERRMNPNPEVPHTHVDQADPVVQNTHLAAPGETMPAPILNFDGIPAASAGGWAPPDTNGEVGATQYVQLVNVGLQVFNKSTGASVLGPIGLSTIWTGFGGVCENNGSGDPVVLYDQIANRWLISQFAGAHVPTDECIAVSTSADATGSWYRYGFHLGANFFDYPHLGVWPDAYYMSMNIFNAAGTAYLGPQPFAFDRAAMLAGNPTTFVTPGITVGPGEETYLPADLDGSTLPAAGAPATFVEFPGGGVYNVWHFHADFATPGNTTFTLFASPAAAAFTALCPSTGACVPESGGQFLDGIADRLMFRLAYRRLGGHESVVGNFTVSANGVAGVRWFELRNVTAGPVTVHQESTYQPDTVWRWMGSAAMDAGGNIAVGYSASSASIFPQIRYAGRLAGDPLSTLPQAEGTLFAGTGSQLGTSNRWGDYSALTIDPVDDCTFWYTNEYYATSAAFNWRTRIGSFTFPSCTSVPPVPTPWVFANGSSITAEDSCPPPNNAIDPGERVTVSFTVTNGGTGSTSNLVGTLENTGGVTGASAAQSYGALAPLGSGSRSFTFTAGGTCGGPLTATVHLQDGATDLGAVTYHFTLGTTTTGFSETFDGVVAPALPAGWTTAASGCEISWVTSTTNPFSGANDAFAPDPFCLGNTELVTPTIAVSASEAQLTFKNNYITDFRWDGMVLEISIDGGAFADITAGGNAFIGGGYNATIWSDCGCPLAGRQAWSGNSGGYITSSINLPPAALGHNVKLKWRMASDGSQGSTGVRIDSITIASPYVCSSCNVYGTRGDFTGDLKSDILWRHATRGEVWLWPMDGAAKTGETPVRTVADTNWEIRGVGDQTGDGKADILWRNKTTGQIYLWPMNGSTPVSETYVATVDPAYDIVGSGDYNGDGKSDILWRHLTNGKVWIWLMNGATPLSQVYVDTVDSGYVIKGSGDLNLDGKSDIVWHHGTRGEVWVWLMNGTTRTSQTYIGTVGDVGYEIVGVADHTGDGKADILWHHATRGEVWIWPMNGTTVLSESYVDTVPDTGYQIVGTGDYNGDTKADILWHHATRGEVWVWLMNGTTKVSETWVATVPEVGYQIVKVK